MKNMILRCDSQLGDVGVAEIHCIRGEGGLDILIPKMIAAVVAEVGFDIESLTRVEARWASPLQLGQTAAGGAPLEVDVGSGVGVCVGLGPPLEVVESWSEEQIEVSTARTILEGI